MRRYLDPSREGEDRDRNVAGGVMSLGERKEQLIGTGGTGGPVCGITSVEARGELMQLVGNVQAHRMTYGEGQRMDGRVTGNCYPFWYV